MQGETIYQIVDRATYWHIGTELLQDLKHKLILLATTDNHTWYVAGWELAGGAEQVDAADRAPDCPHPPHRPWLRLHPPTLYRLPSRVCHTQGEGHYTHPAAQCRVTDTVKSAYKEPSYKELIFIPIFTKELVNYTFIMNSVYEEKIFMVPMSFL